MADISKVILLDGNTYNLKDAVATHGLFLASYGHSTYAEVLAAYQAKEVVYCKASSSSNPGSGSQNRLAFLAYVNNSDTPTEFEFQYYRSVATHSDSQQGDQVYVYKLKSSSGWEVTTREAYTKVVAGTDLSSSYSSGKITLNHKTSGVTAASKGDTTDQTPAFGGTFKALSGTVNAQGHLTSFDEHTVTIPDAAATTNTAGLMSSSDKTTLDTINTNIGNHTVSSDVPADAVFTDTTYSGTSPISVSGTTISHSDSGVTAASKGDTEAQTPTFGGTFKALSGTVDAKGHLTAFSEHSVTIPSTAATTSTAGLMSSSDKTSLDSLITNVGDHIVASNVPANAVFTDTTYTGTSPITISGTAISHATSGVTAASKGDTTNQTPSWGNTFKVTSGTVNTTGHMTAFADHTVTIPNSVATTSANGLMSSTDKNSLNNLQTQVNNMILAGVNKTVAASAWTSSGESTYVYKADVTMTGVDSSYFPIVQFKDADLNSYTFSPKVVPKTNAVTIYCVTKPSVTITIPNIICFKGTSA